MGARTVVPLLVLAMVCSAPPRPDASRDTLTAPPGSTAFVGVTLIPMDRERVLSDQTVVVSGDAIVAVADRALVRTGDATVIDARGKFLMPGLVDAHTHMLFRRDAGQYVANGVTTIIDLGSHDEAGLMALRDSSRAGAIDGPSILMAYFVDGPLTANGRRTIRTEAEARAAVREAKRRGFQFIKAYNSIPESAAIALLDEAKTQHVAVIGHGIRSLGVERGLQLGQAAVAHAEEYFYAAVRNVADESEWRRAATFTRASGAYVIPNLSAYDVIERQWGRRSVLDSILRLPEAQNLAPIWRSEWESGSYTSRSGTLDGRTQILRRFTRLLRDAGVPLMVGTDSPVIPGLFPGASARMDVRELIDAGLTPFEALSAATRVPGEFIQRYVPADTPALGIVAPGRRADLLLLDGNPLLNAAVLAHPSGVMVRGRWLPRPVLDSLERG